MKTGYLISAVTITVLLLIIAFQNIQNSTSVEMLFSMRSVSLGFPILIIVVLGMAAGSLYTIAIQSILSKKQSEIREDEESEF
jgi:uncharacterized integral membrane protein